MKSTPTYAEGLATLARPRYSPGLLLEDEDLTAGVDYSRELNRLLFRSLFGCGVICGLEVKVAPDCDNHILVVTIGSGLALDCRGNAIEVPYQQTIRVDPDCKAFPNEIWVTACYTEKLCRPRDVSCGCDDGGGPPQVQSTRIRAGFEVRLSDEFPRGACSCEEAPAPTGASGGRCCPNPDDKADRTGDKEAVTDGQGGEDTQSAPRDCYDDHMDAICACDGGCDCVVIAKLVKPNTPERPNEQSLATGYIVKIDDVRFIRPTLNGQERRRQAARAEAALPKAAKKQEKTDN